MKRMIRRMICWFVGCNYICLHMHNWETDYNRSSTMSGWQCTRCDDRRHEQWDG